MELMYLGKFIDAHEAERIGLVNEVVSSGEAVSRAIDLAGEIAQRPKAALAADAGFVYVTDVDAAGERLMAVRLPAALEPDVRYAAGIVKGAKQPEEAREFVDGLANGRCADALARAGFGAL